MSTPFRARFSWLLSLATIGVTAGFCVPALASLGGDIKSIEADRTAMGGSVKVTQTANYEIHQMQTPAGTVVTEYLSSEGMVFAVAWHGQFVPQMQQILGTYFQQYSADLQAREKRYGHQPLNLQDPNLVVQTSGHMRNYFGRAYIPDQLPPGMTVDQIQ